MKTAYHHGELRRALIDAARALIRERAGSDFSLSDACRRAGVSTAAPYRHFPDKTAILTEVVAHGFLDLAGRFRAAAAAFPPGDRGRILAVGREYLAFAVGEPSLFRMMFGQRPAPSEDDAATLQGKACFACVIGEVLEYCTVHDVEGDAQVIALQLWTLVHGAASLTIDGDYAKVAPRVDVGAMVEAGAERLLFLLPRRGAVQGGGAR